MSSAVRTDGRHAAFRRVLASSKLELAMEAHSALSALIAEDCGFPCLWGSGLSLSSTMGLRDNSEASWSELLYILQFITDAVSIPVLFDGDTGFGDYNIFRRVVKRLCKVEASGVVIEDKTFPKMNSFVGDKHPLAPIEEFCGKLKAGKDSQLFDEFAIIARTEALIAGHGMSEALRRAESYRRAGADGIFIHSKRSDAAEVLEFAGEWGGRCPLLVAPTTYNDVAPDSLNDNGVSLMICANHSLRSSMAAMRSACVQILSDRSLQNVEKHCVKLPELFDILKYQEVVAADERYLPRA